MKIVGDLAWSRMAEGGRSPSEEKHDACRIVSRFFRKFNSSHRKDGTQKISGSFDKNGLPKDWPEFVDHLMEFLSFYGIGEIFDESVYGKARRRISDLIFCNVVFEDGGRKYCYLSDDEYEAGDLVIVPAGSDNHEAVVRIESVEYHPAEEAPFPLDKIKHVIRRFDEEKDADLL